MKIIVGPMKVSSLRPQNPSNLKKQGARYEHNGNRKTS